MVSFLTDPLLQKFVELKHSAISTRRIDLWLSTYLEEEYNVVISGAEPSSYFPEILDGLYRHAQYTKVWCNLRQQGDMLIPQALLLMVPTFLKSYLPIWDGSIGADAILGLLSYLPLQPFQGKYYPYSDSPENCQHHIDLYATYFDPAEKALARHGPQAYPKLLHCYTDLLRHWTAQPSQPPPNPSSSYPNRVPLEDLVSHVSTVSTSLLLSLPLPYTANTPLLSSILTFYTTLSTSSSPKRIPIILPTPHLSYLFAQTPSSTVLSRIAAIYANYKHAFDKHPTPISSYYPTVTTSAFNSYLRDLYNMLWASKALQPIDKSIAFFCSPSLRDQLNSYLSSLDHEYAVGIAFGLSHNALVASMSAAAWWALEEAEIERQGYDREAVNWHKGPVTQHSLETLEKNRGVGVPLLEYKKFVLDWLAERGIDGVRELMYATHAKLKR